MVNLKKYLAGAALMAAAVFGAASASATTVIGTLQSVGAGDSITLHAVRPNGTPFGVQVLSGISTFNRVGGTDTATLAGPTPNSYFAFCVEPYEDAQLNATYTFDVSPLAQAANSSLAGGIGAAKATKISSLFGKFAPDLASPMNALDASALQVALWEIVSEMATNPLDVLTGNTYFSTPGSANANDILNRAQYFLTYVTTANGTGPMAQGLEALTTSGRQDFLVQVVNPAPEPGTWLMMLVGFGLIGYALRSRKPSGVSEAAPSAS